MNTIELLNKTECSYYRRVNQNKSFKTIKLIDWIGEYSLANEDIIKLIRNTNKTDEKKAKEIKNANLPAITISGVFKTYRRVDLVDKINPIIAIDIDKQDNQHIEDWEKLKVDVFNIDGVFLSSLSCRGEGIYVLVYIDLNKDFDKVFEALRVTFRDELNITIDKNCKDITRLRFASYDENIKIKPEIEMFSKEVEVAQHTETNIINDEKFDWDENLTFKAIYYLIVECKYRSNSYQEWLLDGFRLATFGKYGQMLFVLLSKLSDGYDQESCAKKWEECVKKTKFTKQCLVYYFGVLKAMLGKNWLEKVKNHDFGVTEKSEVIQ